MEASGIRPSCSRGSRPNNKKTDKGRRIWSQIEEERLIQCLKDIIADGWKAENGFKVGYLTQLEQGMAKHFPGTDLRGTPHINSKLHVWKKNYGSLVSMLSKSGIGWNYSMKMVDATDEAWEEYTNVDPNARLMRFKQWPFYEDWCEIFGRDRATGEQAEDVMDAVNEMMNESNTREKDPIPNFDMFMDDLDEDAENMSACQPVSNETGRKGKGKKRKSADGTSKSIMEALGSFLQNAEARLGEVAQRIGYEYDAKVSRKELFEMIDNIGGLTLQQKLRVSDELVQNTERLEFFQSLPEGAKSEYVLMLLAKEL